MRTIKCWSCGQIVQVTGESALCPNCHKELKAASTLRDRVCRTCGSTFPGGPRAWYCPDCRAERTKKTNRAYKARAKAGNTRKIGSTDICQICGKEEEMKMKLGKIKTGFYTDGENIYSNVNGTVCVWQKCDRNEGQAAEYLFCKIGNIPARIFAEWKDLEVKKVKAGDSFYGGEITVVDEKSIEITVISLVNPVYDGDVLVSYDGYEETKSVVNKDGDRVSFFEK